MALEATHIRFALDLKDHYGVEDIDAFVIGAIYPDSRYVTGMDRRATHPDDYLDDPEFRRNDFRKGWHAHLLADTVQYNLTTTLLPMVKSGPGEDSWIERSAIKILQDMDDAKKFDLAKYLPAFARVENPNGEPLEKMREYHAIFPVMYADPQNVTIEKSHEMWTKFGVTEEQAGKMKAAAEAFTADPAVTQGVAKLYDAMIVEAHTQLALHE